MTKWADFEEEVRLLVEEFGYRAECTPKYGDHGVDVIAEKNGRRVAVQVKLSGKTRVGNQAVQMLLGGMGFYDASEALIISTGRLTRKAKELCEGTKTKVVSYEADSLLELCKNRAIVLPSWSELGHDVPALSAGIGRGLVVGRESGCDITVAQDFLLSRKHFRLKWDGLKLWMEDAGSSNGNLRQRNSSQVRPPSIWRCYCGGEAKVARPAAGLTSGLDRNTYLCRSSPAIS